VVFLTAYYGLSTLAQVRAGESVLVHAAAGGVGMAACSWLGIGVGGIRNCQSRQVGYVARNGV